MTSQPLAVRGTVAADEDIPPYVVEMTNPHAQRERALRLTRMVMQVLLVVVVVVAWHVAGKVFDPLVVSSPDAVYHSFLDYARTSLLSDLGATMEEVVLGYLLGTAVGILLGVLLASAKLIADTLEPFILGLYGVPKIAFAPLLVVWLGIDLAPKVTLAAIMTFFVVFFSSYDGIRNVDRDRINAVTLMGASPLQVRRYVVFPGARTNILLGMKLGVPEALVGAIVGEFISSSKGVGYFIQFSTARLDTASVFAGLIVLTALSIALNAIVKASSAGRKK